MGRVRSPKRRVRDDNFMLGYPRIILESSLYWRKHFREFLLKSWASRFRGRRSIWWGWRVTLLAPRIGNDVSYVTQIIDDIHFAWQAQYLVRLEGDFTCAMHWIMTFHMWRRSLMTFILRGRRSAQYLVRLVGDFSWQAQHIVTFWEIAGARNVVFFNRKCVRKMGQVRSPKRRVRDDDFIFQYVRISSDYPRIVFILAEAFQALSPEILSLKISWHAQYFVHTNGNLTRSAHCKRPFICDTDQSWDSVCVAGAVFGEVGVWLFVAGAALRDILGDSRSAKYIGGSISGTFTWGLELKDFVARAILCAHKRRLDSLRALWMTF